MRLVVEVVRCDVAQTDRALAATYGGGGVPAYWIVNLIDRQLEASRPPDRGSASSSDDPGRDGAWLSRSSRGWLSARLLWLPCCSKRKETGGDEVRTPTATSIPCHRPGSVYRISVDQYAPMFEHGILKRTTEPHRLLEGIIVWTRLPPRTPGRPQRNKNPSPRNRSLEHEYDHQDGGRAANSWSRAWGSTCTKGSPTRTPRGPRSESPSTARTWSSWSRATSTTTSAVFLPDCFIVVTADALEIDYRQLTDQARGSGQRFMRGIEPARMLHVRSDEVCARERAAGPQRNEPLRLGQIPHLAVEVAYLRVLEPLGRKSTPADEGC